MKFGMIIIPLHLCSYLFILPALPTCWLCEC